MPRESRRTSPSVNQYLQKVTNVLDYDLVGRAAEPTQKFGQIADVRRARVATVGSNFQLAIDRFDEFGSRGKTLYYWMPGEAMSMDGLAGQTAACG